MSEETITIKMTLYARLKKCRAELRALQACGVDNWEGYGEAMRALYGDEEEDE